MQPGKADAEHVADLKRLRRLSDAFFANSRSTERSDSAPNASLCSPFPASASYRSSSALPGPHLSHIAVLCLPPQDRSGSLSYSDGRGQSLEKYIELTTQGKFKGSSAYEAAEENARIADAFEACLSTRKCASCEESIHISGTAFSKAANS